MSPAAKRDIEKAIFAALRDDAYWGNGAGAALAGDDSSDRRRRVTTTKKWLAGTPAILLDACGAKDAVDADDERVDQAVTHEAWFAPSFEKLIGKGSRDECGVGSDDGGGPTAISGSGKKFRFRGRYHLDPRSEGVAPKFPELRAGVISSELAEALGMPSSDAPPPWLEKMFVTGYPPGYLQVDRLVVVDDDDDDDEEEEEEGEETREEGGGREGGEGGKAKGKAEVQDTVEKSDTDENDEDEDGGDGEEEEEEEEGSFISLHVKRRTTTKEEEDLLPSDWYIRLPVCTCRKGVAKTPGITFPGFDAPPPPQPQGDDARRWRWPDSELARKVQGGACLACEMKKKRENAEDERAAEEAAAAFATA